MESVRQPRRPIAVLRGLFRSLGVLPTSILIASAVVLIGLQIPAVVYGYGVGGGIARNIVTCIALVGMAVGAYVAWPSRWNIPAHLQVAFSIPAYVIPLLGLDVFGAWNDELVVLYTQLVGYGFVLMTLGTLIGRVITDRLFGPARVTAVEDVVTRSEPTVVRRVLVVSLGAAILLALCFAIMGFIPALADDPAAAKFLKGVYREPYLQVAVLYRLTTILLPLFLPLIGVYAWTRRRGVWWVVILAGATGVMGLTLLREPTVGGVLIALGIVLAFYRRFLIPYFMILVAAYVAGSAIYAILIVLGFSQYENLVRSGRDFLTQIAAGAPDIPDQLKLLTAWLPDHELTFGRTFFGGLIPGNFEWNPSVWALTTVNPRVDIEEIHSGGLRLPAPVWGYVSFDWIGALLVPLVAGLIIGVLARGAAHVVPRLSLEGAAIAMTVYVAAIEVFPYFYRLSYLSVVGLVAVVVVIFFRTPRWVRRRVRTRAGDSSEDVS